MNKLDFTGERIVPGVFNKISIEHLHRYAFTFEFAVDKRVLDIACGEGYGSNFLADFADLVYGVDNSEEVINNARSTYKKSNLRFKVGNVLDIPFEDSFFDLVISFETIEHISNHKQMLIEIKRVLKPSGIFIVSTPDKSVFSYSTRSENKFHEKELDELEFLELIKSEFTFYKIGYQKFLSGSFINFVNFGLNKIKFFKGDFNSISNQDFIDREYLIMICCNQNQKNSLESSFFYNSDWNNLIIEDIVSYRLKKVKNGFRYRLINWVFKPLDFLRKFRNRI